MSKFINPLTNEILNIVDDLRAKVYTWCKDHSEKFVRIIDDIENLPNNLGENARKMLEIGILQDKLVKLECQLINHSTDTNENLFSISRMQVFKFYEVIFWREFAYFRDKKYFYNSETDVKELLQAVKELIKCGT